MRHNVLYNYCSALFITYTVDIVYSKMLLGASAPVPLCPHGSYTYDDN